MDAKSTLGMFEKVIKDLQASAKEFAKYGLQMASTTLETTAATLKSTADKLAAEKADESGDDKSAAAK